MSCHFPLAYISRQFGRVSAPIQSRTECRPCVGGTTWKHYQPFDAPSTNARQAVLCPCRSASFRPACPSTHRARQRASCGFTKIKHDGFRVVARKDDDRVRLYSRSGNDLTHRFPLIVEALVGLRSRSVTSGRSRDWLRSKNPACAAAKREAEENWLKQYVEITSDGLEYLNLLGQLLRTTQQENAADRQPPV